MTASSPGLRAAASSSGLRAAGALRLLAWPALEASGADAAVTARSGGVSSGPYATLNLSLSVGDDPALVLENRRRLAAALGVSPGDFVFARQVHGADVRIVDEQHRGSGAFTLDDAIPDTDALVTTSPGVVLAILTADCVPIVLHDPAAGVLACVHAGWRGTVARVCAAAVATMTALGSRPSDVIAGLGPAASPARYQVGTDVHDAITRAFAPAAAGFIRPDPAAPGRWLLDLWAANRHVLEEAGLCATNIHVTMLPTGPLPPADLATLVYLATAPVSLTNPVSPTSPASPASLVRPISPASPTNPASLVSPGSLISPASPSHPFGTTDPASHGYFFSDRAARPCGRLALVARLRPTGHAV